MLTLLAAGVAMALLAIGPHQIPDGSIAGAISDPSGQAVPGVLVVLVSDSSDVQQRRVATDGDGRYRFEQLPAGHYRLELRMPGFLTKPGQIRLEPGESVNWGGALLLGSRSDDRSVERDLLRFTGQNAVDCGRHLRELASGAALHQSLNCSVLAADVRRPFSFVVQYSKSGQWEFEGLTAASDGRIFSFTYSEASAELHVRPCSDPMLATDSGSRQPLRVACRADGGVAVLLGGAGLN